MASEQHCLRSLVPLPRHDCVDENPVSHARSVRRRHHEPMLCIKLDAEILSHLRTRDTLASHEPNARTSRTPVLRGESFCHALVDLLRRDSDHNVDGHRASKSTRGLLPVHGIPTRVSAIPRRITRTRGRAEVGSRESSPVSSQFSLAGAPDQLGNRQPGRARPLAQTPTQRHAHRGRDCPQSPRWRSCARIAPSERQGSRPERHIADAPSPADDIAWVSRISSSVHRRRPPQRQSPRITARPPRAPA